MAINLVGDADNSGALEMSDAGLVQQAIYGLVSPSQVSPLALADGDGDLDLVDLIWTAQAVTGSIATDGPGSLVTIAHSTDPTLANGDPDYSTVFDVASNHPATTLVDGLEISISMAPGESILSGRIGGGRFLSGHGPVLPYQRVGFG